MSITVNIYYKGEIAIIYPKIQIMYDIYIIKLIQTITIL